MPKVPLPSLSFTRAPAVSEEFSPLRAVRVGMDRVTPPDWRVVKIEKRLVREGMFLGYEVIETLQDGTTRFYWEWC